MSSCAELHERLYHLTDTARLPWIIQSGELRPGRNKIAGFPDPDFLWATSDAGGDATASADCGLNYQCGKVRHVRFTLNREDFTSWKNVPDLFPQWTNDQVQRLENCTPGEASPLNWWCRTTALNLRQCLKIETRSFKRKKWVELKQQDIGECYDHDEQSLWLAIKIHGRIFASRQVLDNASSIIGYQIGSAT